MRRLRFAVGENLIARILYHMYQSSTMYDTDVPIADRLASLSDHLDRLSPQQRKAAVWVLEHPNDVGISSARAIAHDAGVTPNTLVRMAQALGFDGFETFRAPFRDEIRRGVANFPDRARWLQSLSREGRMGGLYADMVASALRSIEETFAAIPQDDLTAAAATIRDARRCYVLGVGVNHTTANNFTYLAATGMDGFHAVPRPGSTPTDDLARADNRDVLIAIACRPYRREVVEAVSVAKEKGVQVIGISDSRASPILRGAVHGFVAAAETPQFFPSSVSTLALLETLLSFVIANAGDDVVRRVAEFHERRKALGIYAAQDRDDN